METDQLIRARKKAEQAIEGMAEGPLKLKAFEVILGALVSGATPAPMVQKTTQKPEQKSSTSLAARIALLAQEGFLADPRSLSEIQVKLREHGWHYPQSNLSTPLIRLVRQRRLRRLQLMEGSKRLWKYALP
ncbi:MAG: hypothetical protein WA252_00010 [Candidatus Sulfotelmatobacter sp.]